MQSNFQLIGPRSSIALIDDVTIVVNSSFYVKLIQRVYQYWLELLVPIIQAFKVHFLHFSDFYDCLLSQLSQVVFLQLFRLSSLYCFRCCLSSSSDCQVLVDWTSPTLCLSNQRSWSRVMASPIRPWQFYCTNYSFREDLQLCLRLDLLELVAFLSCHLLCYSGLNRVFAVVNVWEHGDLQCFQVICLLSVVMECYLWIVGAEE